MILKSVNEANVNAEKYMPHSNVAFLINIVRDFIMKIRSLLVFLGMMLSSAGASASVLPHISISPVTSNTIENVVVGGQEFQDYWTFTLGANSSLSSEVHNVSFYFPGFDAFYNIANLSIGLYSATTTTNVNSPLSYSSQILGDSNALPNQLTYSFLSAGNYALKVSGLGLIAGGHYAGSFVSAPVVAVPVPEPETWVMLLVGTVLLGLQLRHKNNSQNAVLLSA